METSLETLNNMDEESFTRTLGDVFEHSPWIARQAHKYRPFENVTALHKTMVNIVKNASAKDQADLLCAHPELAGRELQEGDLTSSSSEEQSSAGLDALTSAELELVSKLNADYRRKFGFPFIIAVRNHTKESIFSEWKKRLTDDENTEFQTCLEQVYQIGRIRLDSLIE
jgi:2-oxo-4-hydroxy-4-carboxy-5-ureidoimidazoline decarboxylase